MWHTCTYKIFNKLGVIITNKIQMLYLHTTSKEIQKLALCAAKSSQLLGLHAD